MRLTLIVCLSVLSLVRCAEDLPDLNQQLVEDKEVLEAEETVQREASGETTVLVPERLFSASSSTPQPSVEYADDVRKTSQDSSQNFVTPAPQIAKISDVLTTQGIPFPTAIANHLISPVSIYQSRLPATPPAAYDVSPPIPAQLAYSEHRIYTPPPQQNSIQYYSDQKSIPNQGFLSRLPLSFNVQGSPQNFQFYQSVIPQQQPHLFRIPQQQVIQYQPIQSLQYNQQQNLDAQRPIQYSQPQQQPLYNIVFNRHNLPPSITYARPEEQVNDNRNPAFPQLQQQERSEPQGQSNQMQQIRQNIHNADKSQGAVSYASFSQSPPSYVPQRSSIQQYTAQKAEPQNINLNLIPNDRLLPIQGAQFILRTQQNLQNYPLQNYQQLPPIQQLQPTQLQQIPRPVQHLPQQQLQYIPRHQVPGTIPSPSQQYLLPIPQFQQIQQLQQLPQPQIYQIQPNYDPRPQQGFLIPEQQQRPQTAPNYLPVQFFGKFAEKIFARYNENEKK